MHDNGNLMVNLITLPIVAFLLYLIVKNAVQLIKAIRSRGSDAPQPWRLSAVRIWVCLLLLSPLLYVLGEANNSWMIRHYGSALMKIAFLPLMPVIWFFVEVM